MAVFWVFTLSLLVKVAMGDACASGRFTQTGQCCSLCPAGSGVLTDCGKDDTVCQACPDGTTSPSEDLSPCRPCARCPAGVPALAACSASRDTHCDCGDGYYLWRDGAGAVAGGNGAEGRCAPCQVCARGEGVARECGARGNTRCQPCLAGGTFSEERSDAKPCQTCSRCSDSEVEIRACQPNSDTLCMDKKLHILSRPSDADAAQDTSRWPGFSEDKEGDGGEDASSANPGAPRSTPQEEGGGGGSNILAYVSVLAAVVLGLLLYVAYKCWTSCKQKQALVKARAAELGAAPEVEKLHSDSGVFLDSHSLQDSQPSKGSKRDSKQDSRLYINLPPHRQEEVELLLQEGGGARGWRQLGAVLGYEAEQLDLFGRGEAPAHTLLSNWAQQEGSTLGLLCSALARVERPDAVAALTSPTQAGSVV